MSSESKVAQCAYLASRYLKLTAPLAKKQKTAVAEEDPDGPSDDSDEPGAEVTPAKPPKKPTKKDTPPKNDKKKDKEKKHKKKDKKKADKSSSESSS